MSDELFHLPDVGEGLTEAEIVSWHVTVGETVTINQIIVEIETAKSLVELPSPFAGTVAELLVQEGQSVDVGTAIVRIAADGIDAASAAQVAGQGPQATTDEPKFLVGYGAREEQTSRRRRGRRAGGADPSSAGFIVVAESNSVPRAKPPVRKLAKVLGVDLSAVTPTGPDDTIVRADVMAVSGRGVADEDAAPHPLASSTSSGGDAARGETVRYPIKGVRKATAAAMVSSAFTAPHVTEFVTVDVTEALLLKDRVQTRTEFRDVKITPLALVARTYLMALSRTPMGNARWDEAAGEIVVPTTVNLGIAAATPRGLVVPNIKSAQAMGLLELAESINALAAKARAGKTQPEEMTGGTTTITNIGVFGMDTATPILNPGESAILAVGTIKRMPWVVAGSDGERIEPRSVMQLALSFDHRVMDGQQGSKLLAETAAPLADPALGML